MNRNTKDHFIGCLVGGAVGDALGWPIEFDDIKDITDKYGLHGIVDMVPGENGSYEITDDTQMTLFTAEGLLRAWASARHIGGVPDFSTSLRDSYDCWLQTQDNRPSRHKAEQFRCGWLIDIERLHRRRAPGNTCLSALREGSLSENGIINNSSKGCGGVMRAAPAGLLATRINKSDDSGTARLAFEIGCAAAALTHGHPSGYYPAGVLAAIIATIITGGTIEDGISISLSFLDNKIGSQETVRAIHSAVTLWQNKDVLPSPESIESLGGGWVGEEALAISIYSALAAEDDFAKGVRLAVNHSGDSDSTGSITGNILGALLGTACIPSQWLEHLELADVIVQVGNDLYCAFEGTESWLKRYPPS